MSLRPTFDPLFKGLFRRSSFKRSSNVVDYEHVSRSKSFIVKKSTIDEKFSQPTYESVFKEMNALKEIIFNQRDRINKLEMKLKLYDQKAFLSKSITNEQKEKLNLWTKIFQR